MKVDILDAHDRLLFYQKQQDDISKGIMDCINNVPDSIKCPFYIYGHARTVDQEEQLSIMQLRYEKVPAQRLIWMPVVTKPKAAPNTYLFLARKGSDVIDIIWMLPKRELWEQYKPGNLCHNENIWVSIQNFLHCPDVLNAPDKNGPTESDIKHFRMTMGFEAQFRKKQKDAKLKTSELSQAAFEIS